MLGTLCGAGMSLDAVLDMTMDQAVLVAESIELRRLRMLEQLIKPLLSGLGGGDVEYRPGSVRGQVAPGSGGEPASQAPGRPRTGRRVEVGNRTGGVDIRPYAAPDGQQDAAMRWGLQKLGIPYERRGGDK